MNITKTVPGSYRTTSGKPGSKKPKTKKKPKGKK